MNTDSNDDLIASITPDVMKVLDRSNFFRSLDDLLCPIGPPDQREHCHGDHRLSEAILRTSGFDATELADIFEVLRSKGRFCDCEILYNVADQSRLKAEYWRSKVTERGQEASGLGPLGRQVRPATRVRIFISILAK